MAWLYLIIAGLLEIIWAFAMKQSLGFTRAVPTVITISTMIASVSLLALAMRVLPLGTAYVIWTGIGAVGTFFAGVIFLGEPATFARLLAAGLIVAGLLALHFAE